MTTTLPPRFLDRYETARPIPAQYRDMGTPATWGVMSTGPFGNPIQLAQKHEQTKHYTYWTYIAVRRICDRVAAMFPCLGYTTRQPNRGLQKLSGKSREWISQNYGSRWLQSVEHDVEPLPETHPFVELLYRVNAEDTWGEFIDETILFLELTGIWYWWVVPNGLGLPAELWVVPSDWVDPQYSKSGDLSHYRVVPYGQQYRKIEIPPEEMIVGKFKSPRSKIDGWGPLHAAPLWKDGSETIEASRRAAFANGINPDVLVHFDREMWRQVSDPDLERIKEKFMARTRGVRRHGEPVFMPPGVKADKWSNTPKEMDYPHSADQLRDNNLAVHGTPPVVAGVTSDYNRATAEAADSVWCDVTINPRLRLIAGVLTEKLATRFDPRIVVYYPDARPRNAELRLKELQLGLERGGVWPDEYRSEIGLEPKGTPEYTTAYLPMGVKAIDAEDEPVDEVDPDEVDPEEDGDTSTTTGEEDDTE